MLWKKKENAGTIFTRHYKPLLKTINTSPIAQNAAFELIPAMYVVCDCAAINSGKNREQIAISVTQEAKRLFPSFDQTAFDRRCGLYGEVIRGNALRCEWNMGNADPFSGNAVTKCAALLGDILYNPNCAENYDDAPIVLHGLMESVSFANSVVKPLLDEFVRLYNDIYQKSPLFKNLKLRQFSHFCSRVVEQV